MTDVEIVLVGQIVTGQDDQAQDITEDTRVPVLATEIPVSRSEFFAAGQIGIHPEYEFIINPAEYSGEKLAEYTDEKGKTHKLEIYRIYESGPDRLELYCSEAVGLER